jgi:hypothetical protein
MSRTSAKIIVLLALLAAPAASYARMAGEAGTGNIPTVESRQVPPIPAE